MTVEQALLEVEEETELDEIRRYMDEAYKRLADERDGWEQEVKRGIARIKAKNKALKAAKIQYLNMARGFLASNFINNMQDLAAGQHWRSASKTSS